MPFEGYASEWLHDNWPAPEPCRVYLNKECTLWALVDAYDYPNVCRYRWRLNKRGAGWSGQSFYARRSVEPQILLHLFVFPSALRPSLRHIVCDHIDGDGLNCQRANLRWVTPSLNWRHWYHRNRLELWGLGYETDSL